jgi:choline transport protein
MVTACIVLLYISYAIPIICLLLHGRNNIVHGPFWLGPFGLFANIVLLLWTCFTLIMYSFPFTKPVNAGSKSSPFFHHYLTPQSMSSKPLLTD